jgi:hypothetical protein
MRLGFTVLLLALLAPFLGATTVIAPDFPQLVAEADAIYRGRVTAVEARRVAPPAGGSVIKTFVTVAVSRTLKGSDEKEITLEFLGGQIGDEIVEVSGVPKFTVGQHGILFVQQNGRQFCPLVRLGHGRYRILRDATSQREYVARENGVPLGDVGEVELPLAATPLTAAARRDVGRALSPADFESRIISEVRRPTRAQER